MINYQSVAILACNGFHAPEIRSIKYIGLIYISLYLYIILRQKVFSMDLMCYLKPAVYGLFNKQKATLIM